MGSLYEKARKMKERNPGDKQNPDPDLSSIRSSDISFDEQVEIIGQINEAVDKNRIEIKEDFAITGGIAKNRGVVERLEKELGIKSLKTDYDTQIAGALGAALFAKALVEKERKKQAA